MMTLIICVSTLVFYGCHSAKNTRYSDSETYDSTKVEHVRERLLTIDSVIKHSYLTFDTLYLAAMDSNHTRLKIINGSFNTKVEDKRLKVQQRTMSDSIAMQQNSAITFSESIQPQRKSRLAFNLLMMSISCLTGIIIGARFRRIKRL